MHVTGGWLWWWYAGAQIHVAGEATNYIYIIHAEDHLMNHVFLESDILSLAEILEVLKVQGIRIMANQA